MSWQQDLYYALTNTPQHWFRVGELYEKARPQIPLHVAMRYVYRLYKGHNVPSPEKAKWSYFLQALRVIGVDRQGSARNWVYSDTVRIRRIPDRNCTKCGGSLVKASWTQNSSKYKCLGCGIVCSKQAVDKPPPVASLPVETPTSAETRSERTAWWARIWSYFRKLRRMWSPQMVRLSS